MPIGLSPHCALPLRAWPILPFLHPLPFLSLVRLCQWSTRTVCVPLLCVGSTRRGATALAIGLGVSKRTPHARKGGGSPKPASGPPSWGRRGGGVRTIDELWSRTCTIETVGVAEEQQQWEHTKAILMATVAHEGAVVGWGGVGGQDQVPRNPIPNDQSNITSKRGCEIKRRRERRIPLFWGRLRSIPQCMVSNV